MAEDQGEIQQYLDRLFVKSEGHVVGNKTDTQEAKQVTADKFIKKSTQEIILESQGQTPADIQRLEKSGDKMEVATKLSDIGLQSMILKSKGKPDGFIEELQTTALSELLKRYPNQQNYIKEKVLASKSLKKYAERFGWNVDELS